MLLSIGAYAIEWGWPFALGFVLLIFVHEMGHAVALRIEGIPAGPPVFIPFVGAFVAMHGQPRDAGVEARVAIAGPISGAVAAWIVLGAGLSLEYRLLIALGHAAVRPRHLNEWHQVQQHDGFSRIPQRLEVAEDFLIDDSGALGQPLPIRGLLFTPAEL